MHSSISMSVSQGSLYQSLFLLHFYTKLQASQSLQFDSTTDFFWKWNATEFLGQCQCCGLVLKGQNQRFAEKSSYYTPQTLRLSRFDVGSAESQTFLGEFEGHTRRATVLLSDCSQQIGNPPFLLWMISCMVATQHCLEGSPSQL